MSGHSKWSTIKRKKGEKDGARAKVFTKISREILVCIKDSGTADPAVNGKLRTLITKAKSAGIPSDNIDRLLKKAAGGGEKNDFDFCVYEGYGIGGVAVMVECLTDNRNRTAGEIRHNFDKYGGNMGATGCVSYLFSEKGVVVVTDCEDTDALMEAALEAGASDLAFEEDSVEILTEPSDVLEVAETLRAAGYGVVSAEVEKLPDTYVSLSEEQLLRFELMTEVMEDNDDVQNIWHNAN